MPLPRRRKQESESDFMERCIPEAMKEADSNEQAVAICATRFEANGMRHARVNIHHRVDNAKITKAKRNNRDVWIVPSAVAKFDTVLNNIFYPRQELESSYEGLNGTTAPLGHPMINSQHVSALSPEAINQFHIGAHNENARIEGDRIMADMILDVEYAKRHPDGQKLLDAINGGKPVSTSTGLFLSLEDAPEDIEADFVGRNFEWDHVAILLDEKPAISTEEGVGLMVNGEQVPVFNAELPMDDDFVTMMAWELVEAAEREKKKGLVQSVKEKIVSALKDVLKSDTEQDVEADGLSVNQSEEVNMTAEELQAALAQQAETLQANFKQELESTVKPLQEKVDAMNAEREQAAEAEKAQLVETVVKANMLDEDTAKTLDVNALRKLGEKAKPEGAAPAHGAFQPNKQDPDALSTDLPE